MLKKQPDFQTCRVLKALALVRLGREEEANPILEAVLNESPTEDATLQAMTYAYKDLQQCESHQELCVKNNPFVIANFPR